MKTFPLLHLTWMFLVPLAAVVIPLYIGERVGKYHHKTNLHVNEMSIGSVVSAALGLLAFMLAFTFQIAANRYDARKSMLLEEVKDIRIVHLRAGLIPEPYRSAARKQLVEYVDLRVDLLKDFSKMNEAFASSRRILDSLWTYAEALSAQDRGSEFYALYTTAVNDVIDAYYHRVTVVIVYRIPKAVLIALFFIGFLSMSVLGYQFGVSGKGSYGINLLLATTFSVVMCLIFALDQPEKGLIPVNQRPLEILHQQLHAGYLNSQSAIHEN